MRWLTSGLVAVAILSGTSVALACGLDSSIRPTVTGDVVTTGANSGSIARAEQLLRQAKSLDSAAARLVAESRTHDDRAKALIRQASQKRKQADKAGEIERERLLAQAETFEAEGTIERARATQLRAQADSNRARAKSLRDQAVRVAQGGGRPPGWRPRPPGWRGNKTIRQPVSEVAEPQNGFEFR